MDKLIGWVPAALSQLILLKLLGNNTSPFFKKKSFFKADIHTDSVVAGLKTSYCSFKNKFNSNIKSIQKEIN